MDPDRTADDAAPDDMARPFAPIADPAPVEAYHGYNPYSPPASHSAAGLPSPDLEATHAQPRPEPGPADLFAADPYQAAGLPTPPAERSPSRAQVLGTVGVVTALVVFALVMWITVGDDGGPAAGAAPNASASAALAADKTCAAVDQTMRNATGQLSDDPHQDLTAAVPALRRDIATMQDERAAAPNARLSAAIQHQIGELTALARDAAADDWTAVSTDLSAITADDSMSRACGT